LFEQKTSCLLTSATLRDTNGMDRFAERCGAEGCDKEAVDSPFDYKNNMIINIASDCPPISPGDASMEVEFLVDSIKFCVSKVKGGSLVLFTSYREMNSVANRLSVPFQKMGRHLMVQGDGSSRSQIIENMKKAANAVVFGTDSFWTGIDVPGTALSQVIVVRIPFENPSHPILEARSEMLSARGEKPFFSLTLPNAQIKLRQGIGRLIRKHADKGLVTILDSRVLKKSYGKSLLEMLPHQDYSTFSRFNRDSNFQTLARN